MKLSYIFTFFAVLTLACTVSTAPAALSANVESRVNSGSLLEVSQKATERPQTNATATGWVRVRSACGAGVEPQPCNSGDLGYLEAGEYVSTVGAVIDNNHVDCQQWQPVEFEGQRGYVCDEFLEAK